MRLVWVLLCGVLQLVASRPPLELSFSVVLDEEADFLLSWGIDHSAELAVFELRAPTVGWLGFGLSPDGGMAGADIVIGGVYPNKTVYFADYHGVGKAAPVMDGQQDYQLVSLTDDGVVTAMRFSRKLSTCDANDLDITDGTMYVIAAFGADDTITFHERNRTSMAVSLLSRAERPPSPSVSYTFNVTTNGYTIPPAETTYACTFIPLPRLSSKHHIYKFEPILQAGNEEFVHHIVLHACPTMAANLPASTADCDDNRSYYEECVQVLVAWAVGGEAFHFPSNVGISLGAVGDPSHVLLQTHYSNFRSKPGVIDSSGIRLYYTPEIREHDVGTLYVGSIPDSVLFIPPGAESFKAYGLCKTSKFTELDVKLEEMQVFASLLHTHLAGRAVQIAQFRHGSQVALLGREMHYDFNMQRTRLLSHTMPIKVGDDVVVECTYNTEDRTNTTYGGLGTRDEMCVGMLYYYPRSLVSGCFSYTDLTHVAEALGKPVSSIEEALREISSMQWDEASIKAAEKAAKETIHTVYVQSSENEYVIDLGPIPDIQEPPIWNATDSDAAGSHCPQYQPLRHPTTSLCPAHHRSLELLLFQLSLLWFSMSLFLAL